MKILIALATYNRPITTDLCLKNLQSVRDDQTKLVIYDDDSGAYSSEYLSEFADEVVRFAMRGGIEKSRARAFRDFLNKYTDCDLLYLTDNDAIHDPSFVDLLRGIFNGQQQHGNEVYPVGLFNSVFHQSRLMAENEQFFLYETCPGISMCYTREMVKLIVDYLDKEPAAETAYGWDMIWPKTLNRPFLVPKNSYVEHFARDRFEAGMHSNNSGISPDALLDFERDRAMNPTDYLVEARPFVIKAILGI
ncbi:glycosyltransferase [Polynucleobacter sp. 71A-WALBACH]|uniref:glycosyltransferase family 2 protein n=1 Tax=Polynucleobacter sp. 71A-WALBACH TaxID=2689097 RepID=UPI001C0CE96C|nr:glycosyltransferase family 2 protein [Polynucleobacter sp. 71A-WALBACH]MBU3593081.1 glycosyltransferase [Polynucleobacter sp. 71A-WALBACH]